MSLTKVSYSMTLGSPVNVFDFMTPAQIADVQGRVASIDVTAAVQAAINFAQTTGQILFSPSGRYRINGTLTVQNTESLTWEGEGRGNFLSSVFQDSGTVFEQYTTGSRSIVVTGAQNTVHTLSNFALINKSGGSTEVGLWLDNTQHSYFRDITLDGFQYLIRGQRAIWCSFERIIGFNCDYGISLTNITATPPLILNALGANGFYNNVISVRDSKIINSDIAFDFAGASISLDNIDASVFTTAALRIGGADFNLTQFSLTTMYIEGGVNNPVQITNATGSINTLFVGQNCTNAVSVVSSRLTLGTLQSYASITNGIANNGGNVWLGYFSGTIVNAKVDSNGGVTWVQQLQQPPSGSTSTITFGTSATLANDLVSSNLYRLNMFVDDNGTAKFVEYIIRNSKVTQVTTADTVSNMTVTSVLNGVTGRYDITIANTAGFAYNITVAQYILNFVGVRA
jgi:hypothetical protein